MIIMPPEELLVYLSVDENGEWIHAPEMPEEMKQKFMEFSERERALRKTAGEERES